MKAIVLAAALAALLGIGLLRPPPGSGPDDAAAPVADAAAQRRHGAYLARAGNCMGCHTAHGGEPYAGGHVLETSIGTFITPNITPDPDTGIGEWSAEDFWQALHHGQGRDGRPLYPAFPYPDYTRVTRPDADALFAYLQSLAPVAQRNPPGRIRFPFNFRPLLHVWRALYFEPGTYVPDASRDEEWNRGAYLVQGLGHCNACHTTRNPLGISQGDVLGGGRLMESNWYAPSLTSLQEGGMSDWAIEDIARLLTTGMAPRAAATGPMAAVVSQSLQHLRPEDARAMAVYLRSLPETAPYSRGPAPGLTGDVDRLLRQGEDIYEAHCRECHGAAGQGMLNAYPALAGNRGVTLASPTNAIRSVLFGGYGPVTERQPRPYGMPPFAQHLRDEEIARVLSYIRNAWGNRGSLVTAAQVDRSRKGIH
ncbi:cytochrome c [Nitrosovibrio sp. Nv17]|uniref:c-type cytochrome n=1 Tax=Nitrosovibrio sp. Nv17 TaxID=1855339 RepID=UPI0009085562|nr:cytochrome c [Nitrosovibrio sp. Nv17]SFW13125.1 Cytochrome c, mono-and diheme variants [Nitrosovibrio sp. Nv17]